MHAHGPTTVADAAVGMLAGQIAVVAMVASYVRFAKAGVVGALLGAIVCWAATVIAVRPVDGLVLGLALFTGVAVLTLRTWPPSTAPEAAHQSTVGAGEFTTRVVLASALVVTLTGVVQVVGPQLAGLLSAAPLVALVLTPTTHSARGSAAVGALLHGVAKGSVGAAAFALVLALSVEGVGGIAFLAASSAGIIVAGLVSLIHRPSSPVVRGSSAPSPQLVPNPAQVLHE